MRGARSAALLGGSLAGIIPADAGSTNDGTLTDAQLQDHPRGCGEHMGSVPKQATMGGSSPRMRGAPCLSCRVVLCARIIPADAGSTWNVNNFYYEDGDHPRGCGEH